MRRPALRVAGGPGKGNRPRLARLRETAAAERVVAADCGRQYSRQCFLRARSLPARRASTPPDARPYDRNLSLAVIVSLRPSSLSITAPPRADNTHPPFRTPSSPPTA